MLAHRKLGTLDSGVPCKLQHQELAMLAAYKFPSNFLNCCMHDRSSFPNADVIQQMATEICTVFIHTEDSPPTVVIQVDLHGLGNIMLQS